MALDLTGQRFGRLTAVGWTGGSKHGYRVWRCQCDCSGTIDVPLLQLRTAAGSTGTRSCGCLAREQRDRDFRPKMIQPRHGAYQTTTYKRWQAMKSRCSYPAHRNYPHYGGRGIRVCDAWQTFEPFLADMGECPDGYSLERIDVNGNYEPANCKWIPWKDQYDNTRQSKLVEIHGQTRTMAKWCRHFGLNRNTVDERLKRGWSVERAFGLL